MQKRRLGQTDIEVTAIGLGGNKFSNGKGFYGMVMPAIPEQLTNEIIEAAIEGGINWFDTAEMYGSGASEQAISVGLRALDKEDDDVVIATKWSPLFRTAGNIPKSIDDRVRYLDGYEIDLYMVHNPYSFSSVEDEMTAMADLVEEGKIRSIGVSNFNAEQMRRAHSTLAKRNLPLAVNQVQYSLMHRKIESNGLLESAKALGVTIIAWAPLDSGVLTGKFHDPLRYKETPFIRRMMVRRDIERSRPLVEALKEMAGHYAATPAQVALNWLICFQGHSVVAIPGASKVHHAQESAKSMMFQLSEGDMTRLDELSCRFR